MTQRERLERRAERRRRWAASRQAKAQSAYDASTRIADMIPLGQPILVGHHTPDGAPSSNGAAFGNRY